MISREATPALPFGKLGRFASVGVAATLTYAALGLLFARGFGWTPLGASVAAYAGASVFSYLAHRRLTFRSERAHAVALPRFAVSNATGLAIAAGLPLIGDRLGLPVEAGLAATCVAIPLVSYLLLDRLVFPESAGPAENP